MDFKLWKFMTISIDNIAEVFKSERTSLVETIILQNFIKFKTKALSKVLRRIRDDKKIKCERLAFNNCHFQKVCPKLFCSTLNKMSYVFIGDDFGTKTSEIQITFLLWTIILHPGCKIIKTWIWDDDEIVWTQKAASSSRKQVAIKVCFTVQFVFVGIQNLCDVLLCLKTGKILNVMSYVNTKPQSSFLNLIKGTVWL